MINNIKLYKTSKSKTTSSPCHYGDYTRKLIDSLVWADLYLSLHKYLKYFKVCCSPCAASFILKLISLRKDWSFRQTDNANASSPMSKIYNFTVYMTIVVINQKTQQTVFSNAVNYKCMLYYAWRFSCLQHGGHKDNFTGSLLLSFN